MEAHESGMLGCDSEKKAANPECGLKSDTFSGRVWKRGLQNCGYFSRLSARGLRISLQPRLSGGESGIRTHVRVSPKHAFQACAFSHSAISPAPLEVWLDSISALLLFQTTRTRSESVVLPCTAKVAPRSASLYRSTSLSFPRLCATAAPGSSRRSFP